MISLSTSERVLFTKYIILSSLPLLYLSISKCICTDRWGVAHKEAPGRAPHSAPAWPLCQTTCGATEEVRRDLPTRWALFWGRSQVSQVSRVPLDPSPALPQPAQHLLPFLCLQKTEVWPIHIHFILGKVISIYIFCKNIYFREITKSTVTFASDTSWFWILGNLTHTLNLNNPFIEVLILNLPSVWVAIVCFRYGRQQEIFVKVSNYYSTKQHAKFAVNHIACKNMIYSSVVEE